MHTDILDYLNPPRPSSHGVVPPVCVNSASTASWGQMLLQLSRRKHFPAVNRCTWCVVRGVSPEPHSSSRRDEQVPLTASSGSCTSTSAASLAEIFSGLKFTNPAFSRDLKRPHRFAFRNGPPADDLPCSRVCLHMYTPTTAGRLSGHDPLTSAMPGPLSLPTPVGTLDTTRLAHGLVLLPSCCVAGGVNPSLYGSSSSRPRATIAPVTIGHRDAAGLPLLLFLS